MKATTTKLFSALLVGLASNYSVASVTQSFSVNPSMEQTINDKIVEGSSFLGKINVRGVPQGQGESIEIGSNSRLAGRTDTKGGSKRQTRNLLGLTSTTYVCAKTDFDSNVTYEQLDAWAKFKNFAARVLNYTNGQIAADRLTIGWNGTSVAVTTDLAANPLLQDVNKGWMQIVRDQAPVQITPEIVDGSGEIRIGKDGDFPNLDSAVLDLKDLIHVSLRTAGDLVVLLGSDLVGDDHAAILAAHGQTPSEKNVEALARKTYGGLPWLTPEHFPARGIVVTSLNNLSIYYQEGSVRRKINDNPEMDQVDSFVSMREAYVVEALEKFAAFEPDNVKLPDGDGGWA